MQAFRAVVGAPILLWLGVAACARPAPVPLVPPAAIWSRPDSAAPAARVVVDSARSRVIVYAGPFAVPSAAVDHQHADAGHGASENARPLVEFLWPVRGWLRGFRMAVTDATGRPLPRDLMHHLIGYNLDRPQLIHPGVERLFGAGRETGEIVAPRSVGVSLEAGMRLGFNVTWHNETGRDVPEAYVVVELPYTPHRAAGIARAGFPLHVDVNYAVGTSSAFDLPPGRSVRAHEFVAPLDGDIIGVGGHLHDHGVELRFEDAESGALVFRLRGLHDRAGRLVGVEQRVFRSWLGLKDARIHLVAGHRYRVVSVYDNPTGVTIPAGGMAHISGLFMPAEPAEWPTLDPTDPAIVRDLRILRHGSVAQDDHEH
ncbi:MAG: hypothetical protein WD934_04585 [Gemmatimonadales bacterium]